MTETNGTTEVRTVQSYRHQIRDAVAALPVQKVGGILKGIVGLSQEQQVAKLDEAIGVLRESGDALGAVRTTAVEARDFAASRDFEAHQAAKGRLVGAGAVEDTDDDADDTETVSE